MFLFIHRPPSLHAYFDFTQTPPGFMCFCREVSGWQRGRDADGIRRFSQVSFDWLAPFQRLCPSTVRVPEMEDGATCLQADGTFEGLNCLVEEQTRLLNSCAPLP